MASSPSSSPWEDRRGMFQRGKEVHEPARRISQSGGSGGVIDAVRRASVGSVGGSPSSLDKTTTSSSVGSPTSERRRSSVASGGLFSNLQQHKRGSEDYHDRRAEHHDHMTGGAFSGWFNSTFRGMKKPTETAYPERRGVME